MEGPAAADELPTKILIATIDKNQDRIEEYVRLVFELETKIGDEESKREPNQKLIDGLKKSIKMSSERITELSETVSLLRRALNDEVARSVAARESMALASSFERLSVGPRHLQISWGKPKPASNFALSVSGVASLNLVLCACPASFWQPPCSHVAEDFAEIRRVFGMLCGCESYSQTCLQKVSETIGASTVDTMMVEGLRTVFSSPCFVCTRRGEQQTIGELGCGVGPSTAASRPDFTVRVGGFVVLISEFKNNLTAPVEQLPQAAASGCNAVLGQYVGGLSVEECRCDLVLSNGHLFQFAAVVLLLPCMPKLVVTSPVLDHSAHADAVEISRRLAWLTGFCSKERKRGPVRGVPDAFLLDQQKYHEKPAEKWLKQDNSTAGSERSYVRIFEKLWSCEEIRDSVVFPEGFLRDDGRFRSIIFEKLDESWFIGIPTDDKLHEMFVQRLCYVVKLMHSCNVVHMDLMPCNIAWREHEGSVHIKLLDFDAATNLPFRIGDNLQRQTLTNRREYMWRDVLSANVRFDCWYCFLYDQIPAGFRVSADVSSSSSPAKVNDPFIEWMSKQDMKTLRSTFDSTFPILQELDMINW